MRSPLTRLAIGHALSAILLALAFPHPGWWWLAWVALVPAGYVSLDKDEGQRTKDEGGDVDRGAWWRRSVHFVLRRSSFVLPLLTPWLIWSLWWFSRTAWVRGVSFPGWFVIAAIEGLFFAAAFAWFGWLSRKTRWPAAVLLPACWVSIELLRVTQPFGGFGWFVLGHTQGTWGGDVDEGFSSTAQYASFAGEQTVSALIAFVGGLFLDLIRVIHKDGFEHAWLIQSRGRTRPGRATWIAILLLPTLNMLWSGFGLVPRELFQLPGVNSTPWITVAAIQPNHENDNSRAWSAELEASRWADVVALTVAASKGNYTERSEPKPFVRQVDGDRADLIVWPESALPGAVNAAAREIDVPEEQAWWGYWGSRHYFRELMLVAEAAGLPIIACGPGVEGVVEREVPDGQGGVRTARFPAKRTNSAYHIDPVEGLVEGFNGEGVVVDRYDKQHLVVAGETIPLGETFPWWRKLIAETISPWGGDYTLDAGDSGVVFEVVLPLTDKNQNDTVILEDRIVRIATPICYEIVSPGVVRDMVYGPVFSDAKRADLLTNLTNNGWYFGDSMRRQMLQIATFRAIENRVPVVMACNTGVSAVIDATGRIVAELPMGQEGVLVADVGLSDARTWYGWWGRWPWWALMWAMVAWSAWLIWRGRRTTVAGGS
ncbi:MAG: apolipoprotein N-acyltransferase [Planctomycetota bacterium]